MNVDVSGTKEIQVLIHDMVLAYFFPFLMPVVVKATGVSVNDMLDVMNSP